MKTVKVMVVDDEESIQLTVAIILERAGYSTFTARNGEECLKHLKAGFRGLLLMDINMPGLNGWETLQAMQKANLMEGNLVCMLTACREPGANSNGLEECIVDYLPKPFEARQLINMVENSAQHLAA